MNSNTDFGGFNDQTANTFGSVSGRAVVKQIASAVTSGYGVISLRSRTTRSRTKCRYASRFGSLKKLR